MPDPTAVKACTRCEVRYPVASGFATDSRASDGLQSQCRACNRERTRIWYAANQERARAQREEFATIHPERKREHDAKYYERNRLTIRAKQNSRPLTSAQQLSQRRSSRKYAAAHREQINERGRRWRMANPDKVRDRKARRYAREHGRTAERVALSVLFTRDAGRCGLCGKPVQMGTASIDHIIPLARGGEHTYRNTQLAHLDCNRRRQHRGPAQLRMVG